MKSLQDILDEFLYKRREEDAELLEKVREARAEKDKLLEQAGMRDGPEWPDDDYRRRVRELVLTVPDVELRSQIMSKLSRYRDEQYERCQMLSGFDATFAERLRHERCRPPRLSGAPLYVAVAVAGMGLTSWLRGPLDALGLGVGLLPVFICVALNYIANLHAHDVTLQEAITLVERTAAESKREARRRLYLPDLFSRCEERTGKRDDADDVGLAP